MMNEPELGHELITALDGLIKAVEGVGGSFEYGTFRGENGQRFKDTPEWVAFYVAWSRVKRSASQAESAA